MKSISDYLQEQKEEVRQQLLQSDQDLVKPGIYSLCLLDKIVYIGKSRELANRLAEHYLNIFQYSTKCTKYILLKEAVKAYGSSAITYKILYYSPKEEQSEIDDDIGFKEAEFINQYQPVLNTQYPKLDNYHSYKYRNIKNLTLTDLFQTPEERIEASIKKLDQWAERNL